MKSKILLVSATKIEIDQIETTVTNAEIDSLITGIGTVATTYSVAVALTKQKYDLVINLGVAGAYNEDLSIGETVIIEKDQFSAFGIETDEGFCPIKQSHISHLSDLPDDGILRGDTTFADKLNLKPVSAVTADAVHSNQSSIDLIRKTYNPDIESMEGAAVFYVCHKMGVKCVQIRSISNYMRTRDKAEWDLPKAIESLSNRVNNFLLECYN